jgi:hypothetical protein
LTVVDAADRQRNAGVAPAADVVAAVARGMLGVVVELPQAAGLGVEYRGLRPVLGAEADEETPIVQPPDRLQAVEAEQDDGRRRARDYRRGLAAVGVDRPDPRRRAVLERPARGEVREGDP